VEKRKLVFLLQYYLPLFVLLNFIPHQYCTSTAHCEFQTGLNVAAAIRDCREILPEKWIKTTLHTYIYTVVFRSSTRSSQCRHVVVVS
jgi:hypothetical protein